MKSEMRNTSCLYLESAVMRDEAKRIFGRNKSAPTVKAQLLAVLSRLGFNEGAQAHGSQDEDGVATWGLATWGVATWFAR
jgi:hypothetical protein